MKNELSPDLPKIDVHITPEPEEEKKARLAKQKVQFEILESYGIDTRPRFDSERDPFFKTKKEQEAYEFDCLWATLFVKAETDIPDDLKERLLDVKRRREEYERKNKK